MAALVCVLPVALPDVIETVPRAVLVIKGAALLATKCGLPHPSQTPEQLDKYEARYAKQPRGFRALGNQAALGRHHFLQPHPRAEAPVPGVPLPVIGLRDTRRLDVGRDDDF